MKKEFFLFIYFLSLQLVAPFSPDYTDPENEKQQAELTIEQVLLCDGCKTLVEGFFVNLNSMIQIKKRHPQSEIDGAAIANQLCSSNVYQPYEKKIQDICVKMLKEHHEDLVKPLSGRVNLQTGLLMQDVGRHLRSTCKTVGACSSNQLESLYDIKDSCGACRAVVEDINYVMRRETEVTAQRAAEILDDVCLYLPLRHDDIGLLEDVCFTMIDELGDHLPRILEYYETQRRNNEASQHRLSDNLCLYKLKFCQEKDPNVDYSDSPENEIIPEPHLHKQETYDYDDSQEKISRGATNLNELNVYDEQNDEPAEYISHENLENMVEHWEVTPEVEPYYEEATDEVEYYRKYEL